jgi:hypothetical protein
MIFVIGKRVNKNWIDLLFFHGVVEVDSNPAPLTCQTFQGFERGMTEFQPHFQELLEEVMPVLLGIPNQM